MQPKDASFFDPKAEVGVLQRRLPHWDQAGTFAFVTFRLIDSLPQELIRQLAHERAQLLSAAGIDPKAIDLRAASAGTIIFGRKISSITSSAASIIRSNSTIHYRNGF